MMQRVLDLNMILIITFLKNKKALECGKTAKSLSCSSNDYLGLTHHSKIKEAGKEALEKWGLVLPVLVWQTAEDFSSRTGRRTG